MSTYTLKPRDIEDTWHVVDAAGQSLGRMASGYRRDAAGQEAADLHAVDAGR